MSGTASPTDASSEDVYAIPEEMRGHVIPRRGRAGGEPATVRADAAAYLAAWLADHSSDLAAVLDHENSDADLVKQFMLTRGGLAAATPLAAAIVAAMVISPDTPAYADPAGVVDAWIATRGTAFATAATLELYGVKVSGHNFGKEKRQVWLWRMPAGDDYYNRTYPTAYFAVPARLRRLLAAAGEQDYAQAYEVLADYRKSLATPTTAGGLWARMASSFLMPEQASWVEDDFALIPAVPFASALALCAITTPHQAAAFPARNVTSWHFYHQPGVAWTALDSVGAALFPVMAAWLDREWDGDTSQRLLLDMAELASAEVFQFLVDNIDRKYAKAAVLNATKKFPRRAVRVLAEAALRDTPRGLAAANVLRLLISADTGSVDTGSVDTGSVDTGSVDTELPNLTPAARAYVEQVRAASVRLPEADADTLPPLFVSPPWLGAVKPGKPVVISGLIAPTDTVMAWRDGEEERWACAQPITYSHWTLESWEDIARQISADGSANWYRDSHFAVDAPEELVRSVLPLWRPDGWQAETWIPRLAVRFGAAALPPILSLAKSQPASAGAYLAPFAAPEAALLAADWLTRLKTARPVALAWLSRHPGVAARTLIPVALGKAGKARKAAESAIRALAVSGHTDEISEAAAGHGDAAARALAAIVADDGTLTLPKVLPAIPAWAVPGTLPQVLLKGRREALPEASVEHLLLMLAVSRPGEPYAGVEKAKDICDPESLAGFAWALFENWRGVEYPPKESWAFDALRWFGDEQAARRLSPLIRMWPGENGHSRSVVGLDVLTGIGGDAALAQLYDISQKAKFKGLKEQAAQRVTEIAEDLGLTAEQLGDRLVPGLGLDPSGTLTLDYGPRHFTVGFDEQLKPYAADHTGKRLKTLPKPGAKDDPELAPAAYQRFSALKKDARALAASQFTRLELAMATQRRWSAQEFGEHFLGHPLVRHITRRLVWATFTGEQAAGTFRVAEDLSLATVSEDAYALPDDALIGIAHPLHLGRELAAWSEVFADYEILQPFEQLGRGVFVLTEEERESSRLTRFAGLDIPVGRILGLERRGWRRGTPQDAGIQGWIWRPLPGGGTVAATLDPGITVGYVEEWGQTQRLPEVFLSRHAGGEGYWAATDYPTFAGLDEVAASELLRDLMEVTAQ